MSELRGSQVNEITVEAIAPVGEVDETTVRTSTSEESSFTIADHNMFTDLDLVIDAEAIWEAQPTKFDFLMWRSDVIPRRLIIKMRALTRLSLASAVSMGTALHKRGAILPEVYFALGWGAALIVLQTQEPEPKVEGVLYMTVGRFQGYVVSQWECDGGKAPTALAYIRATELQETLQQLGQVIGVQPPYIIEAIELVACYRIPVRGMTGSVNWQQMAQSEVEYSCFVAGAEGELLSRLVAKEYSKHVGFQAGRVIEMHAENEVHGEHPPRSVILPTANGWKSPCKSN